MEARNGNIRSSGKPSTGKAEEGYCNKATQSRPPTHSQSHQAQNTVQHTEVKQRRAWTKEEIREAIWYEHVPKSVETSQGGKVTILWNQQVQTDRTVPNNKPDIIIRDNERGTCMLIDVAISGDRNVIKKEAEKILKYKDLTIEIQRMWNVKTKVIPVIIGATWTISKPFRK